MELLIAYIVHSSGRRSMALVHAPKVVHLQVHQVRILDLMPSTIRLLVFLPHTSPPCSRPWHENSKHCFIVFFPQESSHSSVENPRWCRIRFGEPEDCANPDFFNNFGSDWILVGQSWDTQTETKYPHRRTEHQQKRRLAEEEKKSAKLKAEAGRTRGC